LSNKRLLAVARGLELASLVIKRAKYINVFTKSIEIADLAIEEGKFVGIGDYNGIKEIEYDGFIAPGFIDGHVHIESSMLIPSEYAKAIIPRGTTTVIADCHEIANVLGTKGIDFMLSNSRNSPLDVFMMIPSCVPSTQFETAGAKLEAKDIEKYLENETVKGLGEMMDYVSAIQGENSVLDKINLYSKLTVDGHAPDITGKNLNAYRLAGIDTDHECTNPEEMIEKIKLGMYVHLREGSQTKNLLDLVKGLDEAFYDRVLMCSDDLHPSDILEKGHMDNNINLAIKAGIKPIYAILMATKNIADCYKLKNIGAIAPGFKADFVMFKDLKDIKVEHVYKAGDLVASNYQPLFESKQQINKDILDTVNIDIFKIDLSFVMKSDLANVIGLVRNNITTKHLVKRVKLIDNEFQSSSNPGLLKLCVIERHTSSNNIGKGIISDFGLKNGALALTVAHDSHNLIVVGDNDQDMMHAIKKIKEIGGGVVVISNGLCVNYLPLEVAGLMSDKSPEFVAKKLKDIDKLLRSMGVGEEIADPLLQLAFMSLPVIPEIKVTDKGLFDVSNFRIISLEVE